jgi:hypothetical protein
LFEKEFVNEIPQESEIDVLHCSTDHSDSDPHASGSHIDPFYGFHENLVDSITGSSMNLLSNNNRNKELLSVARLLDDFEASVLSAPYQAQTSTLSVLNPFESNKSVRDSQSRRLKALEIQRQQQSLTNLIRSKNGNFRPNNRHKIVSADFVLFMESLRHDILPYPIPSLDNSQQFVIPHDVDHCDLSSQVLQEKTAIKHILSSPVKSDLQSSNLKMWKTVEEDVVNVHNSMIMSLDLSNRGIGVDRGKLLTIALAYCPYLEVLKLRNNRLDDMTLNLILERTIESCKVQYLDISQNDADKLTCSTLCKNIGSIIPCKWQYVNLNHCNLGDELSGKLAGALAKNQSIIEFHAAFNRIGSDDVSSVAFCLVF